MVLKRVSLALFGLAATISLLSCSATSPTLPLKVTPDTHIEDQAGLQATYSKLEQSGGKVFTLDPATSAVRIYAFRSGSAAKLGHNHVLSAPQFTGFFHLPVTGSANARFDLQFRLDQLEIDNVAYRSPLGKAFSSILSPEAIQGTREHMLGETNLQADKFPFVRVHSIQISGEAPKFAAKVQIEMHGQKQEMWIPLNVEGLPNRLFVTGSFVLRQTDFGVQPYSVLGGLLAVQDEVVIEFKLLSA